ncbi:MAG: hypothetical protein ACTHWF_06890 [Brachybacterium sp.]
MGFWGDLPTWLTTLAIVVAAWQFLLERDRRKEEQERDKREQARQLTVWTVTDPVPSSRAYGVILSNTSGSTFHDVAVQVRLHGKETTPLSLTILPPGVFYIEHAPQESFKWRFPVDPRHSGHQELRPYMKSDKYQVTSLDFTDSAGARWHSDDRARLEEVQLS